jgi:hypothetical protein
MIRAWKGRGEGDMIEEREATPAAATCEMGDNQRVSALAREMVETRGLAIRTFGWSRYG